MIAYAPGAGSPQAIRMAALGDLLIVPVNSYPGWLRSPTTPVIALCAPAAAMPAGNPKIAIEAWGIDPLLA